ncbi:ca5520c2-e827-4d60-9bf6-a90cafb1dce8-CDS [Sclerotinia trifoliorum]|uniref:Ca5520c2-e827-4d60-9bf6-a90cafb1dce8-CDS n=1 Tax=Sclerotinia trifoliorum TaxID=28548 RepID=A0A8H2VXW7_9HELO|nr:ca5520c2-e827-4d60-9bf6-a90cafb1dce8-CDS [Sclerotinia trifoliorum]
MALVQLSPSPWHRGTVAPFLQTAETNSRFPLSYHQQSQPSKDLKEEGQILGNVLQTDFSQVGGINAPSVDDCPIIGLRSDSEGNSNDSTEGPLDENKISVESHRLPLADLTDFVTSTISLVLPAFEGSSVSLPLIPFFKIFEDRCEVDLVGDRSKDLTATPDIRNSPATLTIADSISFGMNVRSEINRQLSLPSDSIQSQHLETISNQSYASPRVSTACSAIFVPAAPRLANASKNSGLGNKLACRERKRIILSSTRRPPHVKKSMQLWLESTNRLLDPFREDQECWFHPAPPPPRVTSIGTLRACGGMQRTFYWQDHNGKHSLKLNFGIVSKILFHAMTKLQQDGFINKKWHLSHLCGNWTCLNPGHTTVEPGIVNIGRNNCFSHRCGCMHDPKCMKEKKANLGANGIPIYQNSEVVQDGGTSAIGGGFQDPSMQNLDEQSL